MVGLLPLCATTVIPQEMVEKFPGFLEKAREFIKRHGDLLVNIHPPHQKGEKGRYMLSILNEQKLRRVLTRMLDEERFLSPYGIRSLSKWHQDHPYVFSVHGEEYKVEYLPAESNTGMFGGNSNWRGPIWFPVNLLIIRGLLQAYQYYGDTFTIECPTGSGRQMTLYQVAWEIARRLESIFLKRAEGRCMEKRISSRPILTGAITSCFMNIFMVITELALVRAIRPDGHGVVAKLIQVLGFSDAKTLLERGIKVGTKIYQRPSQPGEMQV